MAASVVTTNDFSSFPSGGLQMSHGDIMAGLVDNPEEGHSVDDPNMCNWKEPCPKEKEDDIAVPEPIPEKTSSEAVCLDGSKASETKIAFDKESVFRSSDTEEKGYASKSNYHLLSKSGSNTAEKDVTRSQSLYHSTSTHVTASDSSYGDPNVYWLNTEFDRLVSDKKKVSKTTSEMRKELKEIGLGDSALGIVKPKTLDEIMREYGLEPSVNTSMSFSTPKTSVKTSWNKFGIMNVSQNNETGSKSENDEARTLGSSVDGDYGFMARSTVPSSRDLTKTYSDNKHVSLKNSFSHFDFKNSSSSSNHDMLLTSKAGTDMKRMEERTLNPNLYFQRERERLQRIDSVMSKTPKTSYTNIPRISTWEHTTTDNTFAALRSNMPSRRTSFASMDQGLRHGGYGEEEKDWGNTSPSRTFLQRPSLSSAKQYSPMSSSHYLKTHDNPVSRSSGNSMFGYSKSPMLRHVPSRMKQQPTHLTKPARAQSMSTKLQIKQPVIQERNTNKSSSKSQNDSSKCYKATKAKPRQSKSAGGFTNGKTKSLEDINKEDFLTRLMENYTGNRAENDMGSTVANREVFDDYMQFEGRQSRLDQSLPSNTLSQQSNDMKVVSHGKYKPYQPTVAVTKPNVDLSSYNPKPSRTSIPTAWPGAFDVKKYSLEQDNAYSMYKSAADSLSQNCLSASNSSEARRSNSRLSGNITSDFGSTTAITDRQSGAYKTYGRGYNKMNNDFSMLSNDNMDEPMSNATDLSVNNVSDDLSSKSNERKPKVTKKKKIVKKTTTKQK